MSSPSHPSSVTEVPSETWHEILRFLDVEDVLSLERTCRFFHDVISDRHFWLKRLQALDQCHAPDLPPYVSISSLTYSDLRSLVIRARRRVLNSTGSSPLRVSKEIVVPIEQASIRDIPGEPFGWGADTLLVPGGQYFLMKWPAGYLQCWDVTSKECMWTYPSIPRHRASVYAALTKCGFACDVQVNGDIHVAVLSEIPGNDQRKLEILSFSPRDKSLAVLFQMQPVELDFFHGIPVITKLYGGVVSVYTEGNVTVAFWEENRSIVITNGIFDALELVDDYIIGVTDSYDGNSLVAISLPSLCQTTTTHIHLADLPKPSCRITPPANWLVGRAQLSVCKFHWQEQGKQQKYAITVLGDVYNEANCCNFPVMEFFSFSPNKSLTDTRPTFTSLGRSRSTGFDAQFSTYSVMSSPSQAGSTVLAFHDDRNHETRFARALATFTPDRELAVRVLDDAVVGSKPATFSLDVEFYSGAIHYVTRDLKNIIIRYLD